MATKENTTPLLTAGDVPTPSAPIMDAPEYQTLEHPEDITMSPPSKVATTIDLTKAYFTKYDVIGYITVILTAIFLVAWIIDIFYQFTQYGLTTEYCRDPYYSCNEYPYPNCCRGQKNDFCYVPDADNNGCHKPNKSISTFFAQLLLIVLIIVQIVILFKSTKSGFTIYEPEETKETPENPGKIQQIKDKLKELKDWYESKKINCRKVAHCEHKTTEITNVEFLYSSFIMVAVFKLISDAPSILLNYFTGTDYLKITATIQLFTDLGNIGQTIYAKYLPCCNYCRARCCWYDGCCCDPCCRCLSCKCLCDGHFPKHHRPFVDVALQIIFFSNLLKYTSAIGQITAVGYLDSSTEWHLWLTCFNFVMGVLGIIGVLQVYWRYFYLMCFYWSREAVNKYENHKIIEIFRGLLKGGYVFYVGLEEDKDEFIRIDPNESIADKIKINCDCFSCCVVFLGLCQVAVLGFTLWTYTEKFNEGFNVYDVGIFG